MNSPFSNTLQLLEEIQAEMDKTSKDFEMLPKRADKAKVQIACLNIVKMAETSIKAIQAVEKRLLKAQHQK